MFPIPRHIVAIAFALIAVLGGAGLLTRSWLEARDDRARLAATLAAQGQVIAAAGQREQQRASELRNALDQIAALKRRVQTPQQVIAALPQSLPALPEPIQIALSPSTADAGTRSGEGQPVAAGQPGGAGNSPADSSTASSSTPSNSSPTRAPAIATIPQADLKPLYDYLQDCRACQLKLSSATADLSDERAKSQALTRERDAAVNAARGGPLWLRVKRGAKWLAIGIAIGAVAGAAAH